MLKNNGMVSHGRLRMSHVFTLLTLRPRTPRAGG